MTKIALPPSEALYPVPVVLVSCLNKEGTSSSIITIAWCGVVSTKPPALSISIRPSRFSYKLIKETGDFVVNIPTEDLMIKSDMCGMKSGRAVDKFKLCSFTKIPSSKISSPMIQECPINIECRLKHTISLGSHDMFIGEVVAVHVDDRILDDKGGIDYKLARPFVYNQGEYWNLGKKIGHYGCSAR